MDKTALDPARLVTRCDPAALGFESTAEVDGRRVVVGQERALEAMAFATEIDQPGYNLFVVGPTGSGRSRIVQSYLQQHAAAQPVPQDVCYVHNFEDPRRPRALRLPAGQGSRLRDHLEHLVDELRTAIPALFDSASYRERREAIERDLSQRHEQEMNEIAQDAAKQDVAVVRAPTGIVLAPMKKGEVLDAEEQQKLEPEERARLERAAEAVQERLHAALQRIPLLQREQRERVKRLDQEITRVLANELLSEVRRAFAEHADVLAHLDAIARDIVEKGSQLRAEDQAEARLPFVFDGSLARETSLLRRYRANLLVDHRVSTGAPLVELGHPTSGELVGKVEHVSQLGVLITDFNLIKGGALHRANGGYLVIDAGRLLMQPVAYEQLKRVLRSGAIRIESVAEALDLTMSVSLEPDPIPFRGKVVLIGESWLYERLSALDPELAELFKVVADFEVDMPRTIEGCRQYAGLLARVLRQDGLLPMQADAVARVIDFAARQAEDSTRLSMHMRSVFDLLREAHHLATRSNHERIERADVQHALDALDRRHSRLRERTHQAIVDGILRVETSGAVVGQINGLSVVAQANAGFGFPTRISARARPGRGELVDIEREVKMGGPIHSKGVLILSAVLGARYMPSAPLSLHASLVLEQSYGFVEGDSASLAELLALLSAIGELPLLQRFAVTGSIDQLGRVQAVGGVNDKIEGFFEVCRHAARAEGAHAVIMPESNVRHLMLRDEVVAAASRGELEIHAVEDVDQALSLVTGLDAGVRDEHGAYPEGSANYRIEQRLKTFAEVVRASAHDPRKPKRADDD